MRSKLKNKKAAIAFMIAAMMAVPSISGATTLAADDVDHEVKVEATDEDKEVEVGNITSDDDGIDVEAEKGYTATVTAGDITADDNGIFVSDILDDSVVKITTKDITADVDGVCATELFNDSVVKISTGDIMASDNGIGVSYIKNDSELTVTTGDIEAYDDGVNAMELCNDSVVKISTGDITSDDDGIVVSFIKNNAEMTVTTGDITAGGDGICASDLINKAVMNISTGDITSDDDGVYVGFVKDDSAVKISTGSITAYDRGIYVVNHGYGSIEIKVNGSITNEYSEGRAVHLYTDEGKELSLVVNGDIKSPNIGLSFNTDGEDGTADVFVEGTIDGDNIGVQLLGDDNYETENLSMTVWKIVPNGEGEIVKVVENYYPDMKEEFEENIMYIIKVEQPTEGGTIAVTDKDGNALDKSHDCDVANQGDKVLVKVNPEEHYKITGAYNGVDGAKLELLKDENGNYYVVVPKGGGVYLTAVLEKEKFDISFYDDDGNLIQTNAVEYGDTITIPDAPTREGYELLYWEGSKYYPGDQYTVTGPHTFKAVWKKIEDKATDDTEDKKETTDKSDDKKDDTAAPTGTTDNTSKPVASSPATDDATNIMMLFILMMLSASGAVIAANLKKRLNRKED